MDFDTKDKDFFAELGFVETVEYVYSNPFESHEMLGIVGWFGGISSAQAIAIIDSLMTKVGTFEDNRYMVKMVEVEANGRSLFARTDWAMRKRDLAMQTGTPSMPVHEYVLNEMAKFSEALLETIALEKEQQLEEARGRFFVREKSTKRRFLFDPSKFREIGAVGKLTQEGYDGDAPGETEVTTYFQDGDDAVVLTSFVGSMRAELPPSIEYISVVDAVTAIVMNGQPIPVGFESYVETLGLPVAEVADAKEKVARNKVDAVAPCGIGPATGDISKDAKAVAILFENPDRTKIEIAEILGISPKSLQPSRGGFEKFHKAWNANKARERGDGHVNSDGTADRAIHDEDAPDI